MLLHGLPGEEEFHGLEYKRVEGCVSLFDLPIARLIDLPSYLSQETFEIRINEKRRLPEDYWNEGKISYLGLSQIKYVGTIHSIHIATFLISPTAIRTVEFKTQESLILRNGISVIVQAWVKNLRGNGYTGTSLFPLPAVDLTADNRIFIEAVNLNEDSEAELPPHGIHQSFHNQIVFKQDSYIVTVTSDLKLEDLKEIVSHYVVIE